MNYAKIAIDNISKLGDTDIFPYPIENSMFFDTPDVIEKRLIEIEDKFDEWLSKHPVDTIQSCIPVGYTGYRWATLIDPLWNAFLLYQVLKISNEIEAASSGVSQFYFHTFAPSPLTKPCENCDIIFLSSFKPIRGRANFS